MLQGLFSSEDREEASSFHLQLGHHLAACRTACASSRLCCERQKNDITTQPQCPFRPHLTIGFAQPRSVFE